MTCKDCIHYEACLRKERLVIDGINRAAQYASKFINDKIEVGCSKRENICEFFADRSRFVELPQSLKIGDEVLCVLEDLDDLSLMDYKYTVGNNAVSDITQVVTEVGEHGFWIDPIGNGFKPEWNEFYRWDEFGKTVFLTREEAEQALRERESNE